MPVRHALVGLCGARYPALPTYSSLPTDWLRLELPEPPDDSQITLLLHRWAAGDAAALSQLLPALYEPLRRLAHQRIRGEADALSLDTTGLVHEAYLKLVNSPNRSLRDRHHFLGIASRVMRNVLVDHARARNAVKRGSGAGAVEFREESWVSEINLDAVTELDEALTRLEAFAPRQSAILEQHYFGGLTLEDIAGAMSVSVRTVKRDLRAARAWLGSQLAHGVS
jgi:RNA polymerase sigma factor (TIGR02999 family)